VLQKGWHKKHDRKRAEGMASGESKRAMAAGAGGILRTGDYLLSFYGTIINYTHIQEINIVTLQKI